MANLSTLLALSEPSGFWISIIKAFEAVTNNYVLAIIFLTVVIRIIWGIVDTYSKYNQQKMNAIQVKMQPELDKIKAKYEKTPQIMNQKQNEVYRKYYGRSYYTGCLVMLLITALNMVIFFTLFSGLNSMAAYNIDASYNNLKYSYVNSVNIIDEYVMANGGYEDADMQELFRNYQSLGIEIVSAEDGSQSVNLVQYQMDGEDYVLDENGNRVKVSTLYTTDYKTDFGYIDQNVTSSDGQTSTETTVVTSNRYLISLLNRVFPVYQEGEELGSKDIVLIEDYAPALDEDGNALVGENGEAIYEDLYFSTAVQNVCMNYVVEVYDETKDSFLWIENIWLADSPTTQSIISYSTLVSQVGATNLDYGENLIYDAFMNDLADARGRVNGYYILPLLCVVISTLSILLNNLHTKRKNKREGKEVKVAGANKWMQIIVPIILGIFALFYNSVFAIYMLTGQVVSTIILPLQLYIVDKLVNRKKKNDNTTTNTVDYARKF